MWIRSPVIEKSPTLTHTGLTRWIKNVVCYPSDIECWFDMAEKNDIEGLKLMSNKGFSLHSKNQHGETIGILACHKKLLPTFRFYMKQGGNIFTDSNSDEVSLWEKLCWHKVSLFYFKLALSQPFELLIMPQALNLLLASDKNIHKIKYWCKHYPNQNVAETLRLYMIEHFHEAFEKTPKIYYYLSGKTQLFQNLHRNLSVHQSHRKLRKI